MMKNLIRFMGATLFIIITIVPLSATEWQAYDRESFERSQAAGEKILVDVYAPWCPTCKAQDVILDQMSAAGELSHVTLYRVDYDNDTVFLKSHRIPQQSTILVFSGQKEVMRSIAETDPDRLSGSIRKALE